MNVGNKKLCSLCFKECESEVCSGCMEARPIPGSMRSGAILNGKYMIGKVLGKGGFGITYVGYNLNEKRRIAIKEFFPSGIVYRNTQQTQVSISDTKEKDIFQYGIDKFIEEAKMLNRLSSHPNITDIYECFLENNTAYYVMEYLEGDDLKRYYEKNGTMSEYDALRIMRDICNALEFVHKKNIYHRDISPDNIFLLSDGSVKLIDFGAARRRMEGESVRLSVILKHGYAPLEQYQGKGDQGPWTDIYALGASMYFMMTGKFVPDCMSRLENPQLPSANELHIQNSVWKIINKCLKMNIAERYQSAAELKADIERVRHSTKSPSPPPKYGSDTSLKDIRHTMESYKQIKQEQNRSIKKQKNLFPVIAVALALLLAAASVLFFGVRGHRMGMPGYGGPPIGDTAAPPIPQGD